jgi:UDP-N-acetylmuramoyl-L-alanyl-D-glutamate--2,6-diaminopimelate ligase
MTPDQLLKGAGFNLPPLNLPGPVANVTHDSRRVIEGAVFVAIRGEHADGHDFLNNAAAAGAALAVVELPVKDAPLPTVTVADTRRALADLSCALYDHPSQVLNLVGITGTNGKTTTAYLVESILAAAGHHTALLGTVDTRLDGEPLATVPGVTARTTPEAPDLQALLARMVRDGASAGVMEVSSHALALERVRGCHFDVAVFTNLTQDHLDFHGTMDSYFEAKCRLFERLCPRAAVINLDDPWGRKLAERLDRPVSFGMDATHNPRLQPKNLAITPQGIRFTLSTSQGDITVESDLLGEYNVYNLLAAAGVGNALGLPIEAIETGLAECPPVPGRMERIDAGQDFAVVVDYAHTADALGRLLTALRPLVAPGVPRPKLSGKGPVPEPTGPKPGRLIVVFGCGGDRDHGKRAPMGKIACEQADMAIFTADNPRSEDPQNICQQIATGADTVDGADYRIIVDRHAAIAAAIAAAKPGDLVAIAGKGHEDTQFIGNKKLPFDDRRVAEQILQGNV